LGEGKKWFKLTWMMCKPSGRLKEIPELTGLINNELSENRCHCCGHLKYKAQWGIHWNKLNLVKWIQNKGGVPNYWISKDSFETARPYEIDGKLEWDWDYEKK
jgi:hypothetical protein